MSRHLVLESIEAFERVGCQFNYCDGPTLEPVSMVTCFVCELLARLRYSVGQPPRKPGELTWEEHDRQRHERYMAAATGRAVR